MTQTTWTGSDKASTVMLNGIPDNDTELYATKTEVESARKGESDLEAKIDAMVTISTDVTTEVTNARDGEGTLLAQIDALQAAILAVTAANGSLVSSNDTTPGFLNGKLVAGGGVEFTENNDAGDETLTIESDGLTDTFMMGF